MTGSSKASTKKKNKDGHRTPGELTYFGRCAALISRRQYKDALRILRRGLDESLKHPATVSSHELLQHLDALTALLEFRLEEDLGGKLGESMPPGEEAEVMCSFCLRKASEVSQLIAGGGVYICDRCIKECYDVAAEKPTNEHRVVAMNRKRGSKRR